LIFRDKIFSIISKNDLENKSIVLYKENKMPLPYQQNKQHIYNWRETHAIQHKENNKKCVKAYYAKNKDKINMTIKAKRKLGAEFYYFCTIYKNLYE
jgi:hypothetical protein